MRVGKEGLDTSDERVARIQGQWQKGQKAILV